MGNWLDGDTSGWLERVVPATPPWRRGRLVLRPAKRRPTKEQSAAIKRLTEEAVEAAVNYCRADAEYWVADAVLYGATGDEAKQAARDKKLASDRYVEARAALRVAVDALNAARGEGPK